MFRDPGKLVMIMAENALIQMPRLIVTLSGVLITVVIIPTASFLPRPPAGVFLHLEPVMAFPVVLA